MKGTFCLLAGPAILAAALTSAAAPAFAEDADTFGKPPRVEIQMGVIDLTTPEGYGQARKRVNEAARSVCQNVVDLDGFQIDKSACLQTAKAQGRQQLATLQQQAMAAASAKTGRYALRDTATPTHAPN